MVSSPALRYLGGKFRLAPWIIAQFPTHRCYVEPFGGAAGVLIQKPVSDVEVYNDLDGEIVNFFRVLQNQYQLLELIRKLELTPYARKEFELAFLPSEEPIERARRICIRAQMGFGSAGATKGTTGFRIDSKRAYGTAMELWTEYPSTLHRLANRFKGVLIENRPAIRVMAEHDDPSTLHFVDPPYLHTLRVLRGATYRHEMSVAEHQELLGLLLKLRGMVCLSGYSSEMYCDTLKGWHCISKSARSAAFRGTKMVTECLWINPASFNRAGQLNLPF